MGYVNIFQRYALQVNNMQAPGLPGNKVIIFVDNNIYTEDNTFSVEGYINNNLMPWAFMNGIYLSGMTHGNFAVGRKYLKPEEVVDKKDEDYSLNSDILNYVFAVMAAATENKNGCKKIILVMYVAEADQCIVRYFDTEDDFELEIKEELEYLEEV